MRNYIKIGETFDIALEGYELHSSFRNAISSMMNYPHLVEKISAWDEMVWLCVEEFLNNLQAPMSEVERDEFMHACALLGG